MLRLAGEAIGVGILTMIVLIIIAYLMNIPIDKKLAIAGVLTGAAVHVGMEFTGGNDWYCNYKTKSS